VRPYDDKFEVVEGAHRLQGARDAHLEVLPCLVRELTDEEVSLIQVKSQALRPQMNKADYAKRLEELLNSGYVTIEQLAEGIGKSVVWIRDILRLNRLCRKARVMVNRGEISVRSGKALARLPAGYQEKFLEQAVMLNSDEFSSLVSENLKQYREMVKTGRINNYLIRLAKPQPYLRSMKEIRKEVDDGYEQAGVHLNMQKARTALDGWKACIIWLLHLDPLSLRAHEERKIKATSEKLNAFERRKKDRELKRKLLETTFGETHE
jgi:ParB/RepB/Spo0J family partition protein